jgi:hypothetical protein
MPGRVWRGVGWQGKAMGVDTRCTHEWSVEIRSKASWARGFLLPFIFSLSPCLIRFDIDRPSGLRDVVILAESSL